MPRKRVGPAEGPSFETTYDGDGRPFKRSQTVFVVVRHTRSGDKRVAVVSGDDIDVAQRRALEVAEDTADRAARDYGTGAASVFKGKLTVIGEAIKP